MAKKTVLKKDVIDKLVAFVAEHQNDKKKLNAGQIREMISLTLIGIVHGLNRDETIMLDSEVKALPLSVKIKKDKDVAYHEEQLKILKAVK